MNELKIRGGAYIGRSKATWPLVTLTLQNGVLELNAGLLGKFVFLAEDVTSLDSYSLSAISGDGLRICHNVPSYNDKIIFMPFKGTAYRLRQQIEAAGFDNKANGRSPNTSQREKEIRQLQASGGFPVKKPFAIAFIVLWNLLFIGTVLFNMQSTTPEKAFPFSPLPALACMAIVALLLLVSPAFARLVLKEGRSIKDIRGFLLFILLISIVMFGAFSTFAI
ncbi:hypothetical protein OGH69_10420 [Flavobacterium sp. MFBS3-15]|uniref:hypothetical protein n=1 Tax=Flavobacterium sp. MFBS3-15 TaxID=2989816 RepID=UPI00223650D6|nr:hypothetical protein [Flavobacterium sp. MFBS3-15]MCW4469380.1 hypothetical protein [Flavobacterium sp. MFBS3-15]